MKTEVFMERSLFDNIVRQSSLTGFFSVNDLIEAGNNWRAKNKIKLFDYNTWSNSQSNKEFIQEMAVQFGEVIKAKRGSKGGTWAHPFIIIDIALAIDPKLKIEVYKWLYDELLKYRNDSGDSYKKMAGALYANCKNKSVFHRGVAKTADMIKDAIGVDDWQKATEKQLKTRDRIHENIALLCDVLRDNNQAIRLGILKGIDQPFKED